MNLNEFESFIDQLNIVSIKYIPTDQQDAQNIIRKHKCNGIRFHTQLHNGFELNEHHKHHKLRIDMVYLPVNIIIKRAPRKMKRSQYCCLYTYKYMNGQRHNWDKICIHDTTTAGNNLVLRSDKKHTAFFSGEEKSPMDCMMYTFSKSTLKLIEKKFPNIFG